MKKLIMALTLIAPFMAQADSMPTQFGTCTETSIASIGTRLIDGRTGAKIEGSGSQVSFRNGGGQVSYDTLESISKNSKVGDPVLVCLIFIPQDCPPGDDRGKVYTRLICATMNLGRLDKLNIVAAVLNGYVSIFSK